MKANKFSQVIKECPLYVPIFKLIKVPNWLNRYGEFQVGDEFYWNMYDGGIRKWQVNDFGTLTQGSSYAITASYLKFVEYRKI